MLNKLITLSKLRIYLPSLSKYVLILCFALPQLLSAQTKVWQTLDSEPIIFGKRLIIRDKYQVVKLDVSNMKVMLNRAPMEFTLAAQNSEVIIELPMPDGRIQQFAIVESPIMEPSLATQFPEIKTYGGYSLENKATTVRLDFTPAGFHAMILSPEGTFFIDPYSYGTIDYYISYDKKDFTTSKPFTCGVDSDVIPPINPPDKKGKLPKSDNSSNSAAKFGDNKLRTYRLALAATGEYTAFHGGTVVGALSAQVTTMNRVNGVFLKDFAVRMDLVANNNLLIYTNAGTDPYTNDDGDAMLDENVANIDAVIGTANYDIGHVFSTGGGGIAYLQSVCNASIKAMGVTGSDAPVADAFDIDYVAHEIGHQFGGNHTQNNNCNRNNATAFEPGSASTIMGYAGVCAPNVQLHSDAYFHGGSLQEMQTFITGNGNTCATKPAYTNAQPIISTYTASQTIPKGTPILLSATATDANGNASLTYCWEQMDNAPTTQPPLSTTNAGPNFRSFNPNLNGTRYLPQLSDLVANISPTWEVISTEARILNFRLVVRDNASGGGFNDHVDITLLVDGVSGPFIINAPSATSITWAPLSTQNVTWNTANTNNVPISCTGVDILLSTDGGLTYPTVLATAAPNTGSKSITVPNLPTTTARIMVRGTDRAFFDISNNNFTISCIATASSNSPQCTAGTLNLSANTGASYAWSGPNSFSSTSQNPSINNPGASSAGTYTVTVTSASGCSATATTAVTINQPVDAPTGVLVSKTSLCYGSSITLTANCTIGPVTWYNQLTGGTPLASTQSPTVNTTYYATCGSGVAPACTSNRVATSLVTIIPAGVAISTNVISGNVIQIVTQTIAATNKIFSPATVAYQAGKAIYFNNGFEVKSGAVFKAEIKECVSN